MTKDILPLRPLSLGARPQSTRDCADLSTVVVDCIFKVHKTLGPGLLESSYAQCLHHEMKKRGLKSEKEQSLPIQYDDLWIEAGYRVDFLIEGNLIVELKSIEKLLPIHSAQIHTYLKHSGIKTGLLVNFNVPLIKDGIKRYSV